MNTTQYLTVDLLNPGVPNVVHAKQYDVNSRVLVITLLANGQTFVMPNSPSFLIGCRKPDRTSFLYNTFVEATPSGSFTVSVDASKWLERDLTTATFTYDGSAWKLSGNTVALSDYGVMITSGTPVSGNTITVANASAITNSSNVLTLTIAPECLTEYGRGELDIFILSNDNQIGTFSIILDIEKAAANPFSVISEQSVVVMSAQIRAAVESVLSAHPEWTTTVQDGSVTYAKLADDIIAVLNSKANIDGYYENLGAGTAEQLISSVFETDNEPYLFRTSGGSADIGTLKTEKLVGGTICWNQLVGSATTSVTLASGRKYAARISDAWTVAASHGTAISVSSGDLLFDLGLMFGTAIANYVYGLEQSTTGSGVAWFRSLFPKDSYAYNAGELLSVNASCHETIGFNAYDPTTGTAKLLGGKAYQITGTYTALSYADVNGASETITPDASGVFTPTNSGTLTVTGGNATDTCVHLVWSGYRNGEYEPYRKHSYALDSSLTLRGVPKLSAGNKLYYDGDTYASDGTVTRRYGTVDLGTLTWVYDTTYSFFMAQVPGIRRLPWAVADANPLVCSAYPFAGYNGSNAQMVSIPDKSIVQRLNNEAYIRIKDSAYTNAAAFTAAMSGKMLVFERETPVTESAEPYRNPQIVDDFGTEEYVDYAYTQGTRDVAVPVGHETEYMANLRDKLQKIPALPATAGDYKLRVTVSNGIASYAWVSAS